MSHRTFYIYFSILISLAAAKKASSRFGGLSPITILLFSVSPPGAQSGKNKNVYVSQVPNPPYAVPGKALKQETKHLTPASIHLGSFVSPPSICSTPATMKLLLQFSYSAIAFIMTANLSQSVSLGGTCTSSSDVRDIFTYI